VKKRRLSELERQTARAYKALDRHEWWNGKRWRAKSEGPNTAAEADAYRTAHQRIEELSLFPQGVEQYALRLRRSAEADRDEGSISTSPEADAEMIFQAAKPHLRERRTPWSKLAARLSVERKQDISATRLRMICRQRSK
jgi:hypothetical protein